MPSLNKYVCQKLFKNYVPIMLVNGLKTSSPWINVILQYIVIIRVSILNNLRINLA